MTALQLKGLHRWNFYSYQEGVRFIRDLDTDEVVTLKITDWGSDQQHGDVDERIAALDKDGFRTLHGNITEGVLYARLGS